ncbi:hypothetical protein [Aquimarina algiphila]|uniref:hypothetical protein n=1 Tax=Aquimarina algiphila TaxID=2047982 RepID=UPI00232AD14E|nr:hypothetical protein [Aquimarina algiphila]
MKSLYRVMMIGIICLFSNITYAQIEQYSEDGTTSCIDCEAKSKSERQCLCISTSHLGIFNRQLETSTEKDKWLYGQELLLAGAITGINYFAQDASPQGLSPDYNFENIQRGYFKGAQTDALANEYFTKIDNILKAVEGVDSDLLASSTINAKILDIRKREGTASPKYGDLKYNGKLLKSMTDGEVNALLTEQLNIRNSQRSAKSEYNLRRSRLQRMLNEGYISNTLAGHLVVHYKSLDYENAVRFMTRYMIWVKEQDRGVPYLPFGNPNNIFTLEDNEDQYIQTLTFRTGGTTPPMDGYTPPQFEDITDDAALFGLALRSLPNQTTAYVNGSGKENVKSELKKYFETNTYSSESMTLTDNLITAHTNGQAMNQENMRFSHYSGYPPDHPIHLFETGQTGGSNRIAEWNLGNTEIANGVDGFFNLTEAMRTSDDPLNFTTEGSLVRSAIELGGRYNITWGSYTDEDLGRLFNLGHSTVIGFPFGQVLFDYNLGRILYDNGFTARQFFRSDFALHAALSIANNNGSLDGVYFDDEILDRLKGTEKCLHNILRKGHTTFFRNLLNNFLVDDTDLHIIITSVPEIRIELPNGQIAYPAGVTRYHENTDLIDILISSKSAKNSSNLITIRNMLHEYIHAEIYRRVYSTNSTAEADYNFGITYLEYAEKYNVDHQVIAEQYLESMAKTLEAIHKLDLKEDFDNLSELLKSEYPNGLTIDFYKRIAWEGLQDSKAWGELKKNNLAEYNAVLRTVSLEREHGGQKDDNICSRN